MKFVFTLTLLVVSFRSFSQVEVESSEWRRETGDIVSVSYGAESHVYKIRKYGLNGSPTYKAYHSKEGGEVAHGVLDMDSPDGGTADFLAANLVGDKLVIISSDKESGERRFYTHEFDENIEPIGEVKQIASYDLELEPNGFQIRAFTSVSDNKQYSAFMWEVPTSNSISFKFGYRIYDNTFNVIGSGEYSSLNYSFYVLGKPSFYLSDQGELFHANGGVVSQLMDGSVRALYLTRSAEVETSKLRMDENGVLYVSGTSKEKGKPGTTGVFFAKMSFDSMEVLVERFTGLDIPPIKVMYREYQPVYKTKEVQFLDDGGALCVVEYENLSWVPSETRAGRQGFTFSTGSVMIFRFDPEGDLLWESGFGKVQTVAGTESALLSIKCLLSGGNLRVIYNDNSKNFDSHGVILDGMKRVRSYSPGGLKGCIAMVEIDIESGLISSHKRLLSEEYFGVVYYPEFAEVDAESGELKVCAVKGGQEALVTLKL